MFNIIFALNFLGVEYWFKQKMQIETTYILLG